MRRRGFTLVELLCVVSIVMVLVALLMPALGRVREAARQAACAANLHQLTGAMLMYATDNEGRFPFHAGVDEPKPMYADWIYWEHDRDLGQSPVAKYISGDCSRCLRCPSDRMDRPRVLTEPYLYSYVMNMAFSSLYNPAVRLATAQNPSAKILLAEEDELSLDDGNFNPFAVGNPFENYLGTRHDMGRQSKQARGNVGLADGHVEFVDRQFTQVAGHFDPMR